MERVRGIGTALRGEREIGREKIESTLQHGMSRRRLVRLVAMTPVAAILAGGLAKALPADAAGSSYYRTTTSLNLRAEPSTKSQVLLVIPAGAAVYDIGYAQNGFAQVEYQGTVGWAYLDYLESTHPDLLPPLTGTAVTMSDINFRSGPSFDDKVQWVLSKGTTVETSDKVVDGFRNVRVGGTRGWVYDAYLGYAVDGIEPGEYLTVTSDLNLREMPSTDSKVMLVMPAGAQVQAMAQSENGFRSVIYNGGGGWAYEAYLA
jgi:uncharacterized protein YraI